MHHILSPDNSDPAIEREIQAKGLTAPRVTPAMLEAEIASEHYFTAADGARLGWLTRDHSDPAQRDAVERIASRIRTSSHASICADIDANSNGVVIPPLGLLTFCVLVLRNGFTVVGKSACASPENFDAEVGRRVARADAVNQMWPLLGFRLRDQLADLQRSDIGDVEPAADAAAPGELAPHQRRVVAEKEELSQRLLRLYAFFQGKVFQTLPMDERSRLRNQARFMDGYLSVLEERIAAFSPATAPIPTVGGSPNGV